MCEFDIMYSLKVAIFVMDECLQSNNIPSASKLASHQINVMLHQSIWATDVYIIYTHQKGDNKPILYLHIHASKKIEAACTFLCWSVYIRLSAHILPSPTALTSIKKQEISPTAVNSFLKYLAERTCQQVRQIRNPLQCYIPIQQHRIIILIDFAKNLVYFSRPNLNARLDVKCDKEIFAQVF